MEQWIPISISTLALFISLISLWKSYLAPFKLKVCHDSPTFALHKITPAISGGKSTWWIPSIDMGFTFHNLGRKSGEVTDIRMLIEIDDKKSKKNYTFYAKWVVDYPKFQQDRTERMNWIHNSVIRDWYPLILTGEEQKSLHLILEGHRWDNKIKGELNLCLEIYSSQKKKWTECSRYNHIITREMFDEKSCYSLNDSKLSKIRKKKDNWHDEIKV